MSGADKQKSKIKRYLRWIGVLTKMQFMSISFYLSMAGILLLLYLTKTVVIPGAQNNNVGICISDSTYGERIANELRNKKEGLSFHAVENEESLKEGVYRGEYDCGFFIDDTLDDAMADDDLNECITYIYAPSTTKGEVAKESVYAALFVSVSRELLKINIENGNLFEEYDSKLVKTVLDKNEAYRNGNEVFEVDFEENNTDNYQKKPVENTFYGILGIGVFALALFNGGYKFSMEYQAVSKKLILRERMLFLFLKIVIPAFLMGMIIQSILLIIEAYVDWKKLAYMAALSLLSGVFTLLFLLLFRSEERYLCSVCAVLIAAMLVCPVFFDLSAIIPAVSIINKIFPLTYYLMGISG